MKKRIISMILTICTMVSLVIPAFATDNERLSSEDQAVAANISLREKEYIVCVDSLPNGGDSVITGYDRPDGMTEYVYYENGEKIRTYTVMPGSGYYKVKENTSSVTRGMNDSSEKTVYVGTANQGGASLVATNSSDYKYWGTVSYYNQFLNETYKIRCTIKEDVDTDGRFSPKAYYAEKAAFIANIVAFFVWPTKSPLEKAADKIFKNAIEKALFVEVVGDLGEVIKYELKKKFTVDATYISYRIKGVGITGNPSGEFESRDGYKATVSASDGLFNKTTYTGIWTKDDWRNPTMGRLMFWAVYGNEYSPTEWNP